MLAGCTPWPAELAERYRAEGYWRGETLGDLLRGWARAGGDRVAVRSAEGELTYTELDAAADGVALRLRQLGMGRGDRVVVQIGNTVEFPAVVFGLLRLGVVPVFALPAHREHEIGYLVEHTEAVAYLAGGTGGSDYARLGEVARKASPSLRHVLLLGDGPDAELSLSRLVGEPPGSAAAEVVDADPPDPADVAFFLLSGGTTGLPKLIPRTHDDYAYNLRASAEVCGLSAETVYMVSLPAAHNFPLGCPGLMETFSVGGRVVMAPSPRPEDAMATVEREGVTITALVPALVIRWLEVASGFDLSSLQLLQVGGARLVPEVARRVEPELGCRLQQVFGMAEGLLNYTRADDPAELVIETQGRPLAPADEIRIVDPDGDPVGPGEPGELLTRGPYTIRGYYRADEHNARAFTADGFYRTGDVVRLWPTGHLSVEGRAKDLINRGGEKISAEEIENLLLGHPGVREAAAVAMPHSVLGEQTCAYVVPRDAAAPVSLADLTGFLSERGVARYKWPERLELVDSLPVTNVGKVDKKRLREDVAAKLDAEQTAGA